MWANSADHKSFAFDDHQFARLSARVSQKQCRKYQLGRLPPRLGMLQHQHALQEFASVQENSKCQRRPLCFQKTDRLKKNNFANTIPRNCIK